VIEEHLAGFEHRFLVIGGRFVAAARRIPANIVGDGRLSVRDLIESKNTERRRTPIHRENIIKVDDLAIECLCRQGFTLDDVVPRKTIVYLRAISNVSMGGDSVDVTECVHPSFISIAEKVWSAFPDRAIFGVDIIAENISSRP